MNRLLARIHLCVQLFVPTLLGLKSMLVDVFSLHAGVRERVKLIMNLYVSFFLVMIILLFENYFNRIR